MKSNLIDRYIAEIGKHLPVKERADIQKEIRSTLEDMLEDRSQKAEQAAQEEMLVVELLKEFGKPENVAASYLPERRLIGPQFYPIFSLVAWIALPTLAAVLLITLGIGVFSADLTPLETLEGIGTLLLQVGQALVSAFGSIVLTFAILERAFGMRSIKMKVKGEVLQHMPGMKFKVEGEEKAWDPRNLPEVQDVEKFSIPGLVAEIIFTVAAIVVFNFFPQIIGFGVLHNNDWTFLPLLSEAFFRYLPYVNALWGLQIVLDLILLSQGRWAIATRWLRVTLLALGIALAAIMLAGSDLVVSTPGTLIAAWPDLSAEAVYILALMPRILAKAILGLAILGNSVELLKTIMREVNNLNRS